MGGSQNYGGESGVPAPLLDQVGRVGLLVADGNGGVIPGNVPISPTLTTYERHPARPSPRASVPAQGPGPARSQHGSGGVVISAIRSVMSALAKLPVVYRLPIVIA